MTIRRTLARDGYLGLLEQIADISFLLLVSERAEKDLLENRVRTLYSKIERYRLEELYGEIF